MQPDLQFSVLCDDVGRSGDGKLIIYGVFEGIVSQEFPATHRACYVCNRWTGGSGAHRERIRVVASEEAGSQVVLEGPETQFELTSRAAVHTVVCRLEGLRFNEPGVYWVQVMLNSEIVCEYALNIQRREPGERSERARGRRNRPPAVKH